MSRTVTLILGLYLIILNIGALLALFWVWPETSGQAVVSVEVGYLIISIIGGMLGTSIAVLTSFTTYIGNQRFVASWSWWYVVRPLIGATIGFLTYAAIRGGILKVDQQVDVLNPYAVTTLSALAGLYSKQLVDWLKKRGDEFLAGDEDAGEVHKTLFKKEKVVDKEK